MLIEMNNDTLLVMKYKSRICKALIDIIYVSNNECSDCPHFWIIMSLKLQMINKTDDSEYPKAMEKMANL